MVLTASPTLKPCDARPDRGDGPRRLVAQAGGELRVFQVLAAAEHRLGAVEPQRLDADLDLALAGRRDLELLDLEDFGAAGLVESHDSRHVPLLLRVIRRQTISRDSSGRDNSMMRRTLSEDVRFG